MKVYVASSWRNDYQPAVVTALRQLDFDVYDFKDEEGFHWTEVDPDWQKWPEEPGRYILGLDNHCANRGFNRDMTALKECDICIMVMPCGMSASLETGWAVGAGKRCAVYIPAMREPDLMIKMTEFVTLSLIDLVAWCVRIREQATAAV
jgi:hypothetical protein